MLIDLSASPTWFCWEDSAQGISVLSDISLWRVFSKHAESES